MKLWAVLFALACSSCGGAPKPSPPSPEPTPVVHSLVGDFERQDPEAATVIRFSQDGTCAVGATVADLVTPSHRCTWTLDGKRLTFTNVAGICADAEATRIGAFDIEVTEATVSFKMIDDKCARRMSIDGQTWLRLHQRP